MPFWGLSSPSLLACESMAASVTLSLAYSNQQIIAPHHFDIHSILLLQRHRSTNCSIGRNCRAHRLDCSCARSALHGFPEQVRSIRFHNRLVWKDSGNEQKLHWCKGWCTYTNTHHNLDPSWCKLKVAPWWLWCHPDQRASTCCHQLHQLHSLMCQMIWRWHECYAPGCQCHRSAERALDEKFHL